MREIKLLMVRGSAQTRQREAAKRERKEGEMKETGEGGSYKRK